MIDCAPGDFAIVSTQSPFDAEAAIAFHILVVPRLALSPHLTGGRRASAVHYPAGSPLGALLGAAFDAAYEQAPPLPDRLVEGVLRNLVGLVALMSEGAAPCGYFDLWTYEGTLQRLHETLYATCREQAGKEASQRVAIIDSQSVKSAEKGGPSLIRVAMTRARRSRVRKGIFSHMRKAS